MKSLLKLIRRFVGLLLLSAVLLIALNLAAFVALVYRHAANASPWSAAQRAADAVSLGPEGPIIPDELARELDAQGVWAVLIDNSTLKALWHSEDLPEDVPLSYDACGIASLTRGYIAGCPTFTGRSAAGLMVLGYPPESFWKHMWPSWDYSLIANAPRIAAAALVLNGLAIFAIYICANMGLMRSLRPVCAGIQALPTGAAVELPENGLLSELKASINSASQVIAEQRLRLRQRDTARANWIAGVSHDIRTPLSLVTGYASQLESDPALSGEQRRKAAAILSGSLSIGRLVSDMNLASRLEYDMQPLGLRREDAAAIVRQAAAAAMDACPGGAHNIQLSGGGDGPFPVLADRELIARALTNLTQNACLHNPSGCTVYVSVAAEGNSCVISVEDNGAGVSPEELSLLNGEARPLDAGRLHGLGLMIVKQIAAAHGGSAVFGQSAYGGFAARLTLPLDRT